MTARLVLVPTMADAPPPADHQTVVVLDTAWRPEDRSRPDVLPVGPAVRRVLAARDPFTDARVLLDDWADAVDLPGATVVDGMSWWFRHRHAVWLGLTRALHWRAILGELVSECRPTETLVVPDDDEWLVRVADVVAAHHGLACEVAGDPGVAAAAPAVEAVTAARPGGWWGAVLRRAGRHPEQRRSRELHRRRIVLRARLAALRAEGGGPLLVLVSPLVAQAADLADGSTQVDPFLEPVVRACAGTRLEPVTLAIGSRRSDDRAWSAIEPASRWLPESVLDDFWRRPGDREAAKRDAGLVADAVAALPPVALSDGGIDVSGLVRDHLVRLQRRVLHRTLLLSRRMTRMVDDLGLSGVLLYNEYNRRDFVVGARAAGVPAFAVQHGIIYPGHVGYVQRRGPDLVLPTATFVFGEYEADVLRTYGGFHDDEVVVTGSPRHAFVAGGDLDRMLTAEDREAVRARLGVVAGDRMLVLSTTHEGMHRRFYWANCLEQLLDGPLPGTHLVFKQHPAELDEGDYRALVASISRRAGVPPPPVTVVRDIDLYTLLRAADAHLGLFSTVLTDAVAAGTPNLVATTQARRDLLGYVDAGVAVAVSSNEELREALRTCAPPDPAARAAFLARHMAAGDAPARIRDAVLSATRGLPEHVAG